jgi:hypothetical protein
MQEVDLIRQSVRRYLAIRSGHGGHPTAAASCLFWYTVTLAAAAGERCRYAAMNRCSIVLAGVEAVLTTPRAVRRRTVMHPDTA